MGSNLMTFSLFTTWHNSNVFYYKKFIAKLLFFHPPLWYTPGCSRSSCSSYTRSLRFSCPLKPHNHLQARISPQGSADRPSPLYLNGLWLYHIASISLLRSLKPSVPEGCWSLFLQHPAGFEFPSWFARHLLSFPSHKRSNFQDQLSDYHSQDQALRLFQKD